MNALLDYFKNNISIPLAIEKKIEAIIVEKEFSKGEMLLLENSMKKEHIFVVSGCLRSFYKTESGKEYTVQFAIKDWWISDYNTLYTTNASILAIESLMPSKVLILDKDKVDALYKEYPLFETFQRKNFEKRIATLQRRILSLLTLSATEKYDQFLADYAEFEKIIPNYQIASYLGITPQSLSRIRKARFKR